MKKSKFETLEVALEVVAILADGPLDAIKLKNASLADQLDRASTSTVLNLAEGSRRRGRDRANRYTVADAEAEEARNAVRVAVAKRYLSLEEGEEIDAVMDRLAALRWRLLHPKH